MLYAIKLALGMPGLNTISLQGSISYGFISTLSGPAEEFEGIEVVGPHAFCAPEVPGYLIAGGLRKPVGRKWGTEKGQEHEFRLYQEALPT